MNPSLPELPWLRRPGGRELRGWLQLAGLGCLVGFGTGNLGLLLPGRSFPPRGFAIVIPHSLASVGSFGMSGSQGEIASIDAVSYRR